MKALYHFLVVLFFGSIFSACLSFDEDNYSPSLIMEGWITQNDYPVIQLGQSISLDNPDKDLSDYIVHWGIVTISDGTHTEELRCRYDSHYFPPFIYTTYNLKGEAGKSYTITAEYKDMKATAQTTIPQQTVKIDSTQVVHVRDSLYYIKIFFTDNPNEEDYYLVSSKRTGKDLGYQVSMMGVLSDALVKTGPLVQMDVYKGSSFYSSLMKDNNIYFVKGDHVKVRLTKIDRISYLFWKSFLEYKNLASNMLFPYTADLNSNIQGGKGYWCGGQTDNISINIDN